MDLMTSIEEVPDFIRTFLSKRKPLNRKCPSLFVNQPDCVCCHRHKSFLVPYMPAPITRCHLPVSFISGLLEDGRFWTDGAILVRRTVTLRPTEAVICLDGDIDSLLTPGERIIQAFFFFNADIIWFPLVLMISKNCFMTFLPDYIDYVVNVGTSARHEAQFFLSENKKGCILLGKSPKAYVSCFEVSNYVNEQIESLVRNLYASKICRH